MAWLTGWDKRIKLDIDYTNKIGASVTWFPVTIHLKDANGDSTKVFEEVTTNSRKIAITKTDGTTELKGEIEQWSYDAGTPANSVGIIHTSATGWTIDGDTSIYLYYDNDHADNANIGVTPGSSPASDVWDGNFVAVYHLNDDDNDTTVKDSTSNENDGTKKTNAEPTQADGKIDKAQDFESGSSVYITCPNVDSFNDAFDSTFSVEKWVKPESMEGEMARLFDKAYTSHVSPHYVVYTCVGYPDNPRTAYYAYIINTAGTGYLGLLGSGEGSAVIGTWAYVAITTDIGAPALRLYLNDAEAANDTISSGTYANYDVAAKIGRYQNYDGCYYDGIMDEFRVSSVVRTAPWLKGTYNSGNDSLLTYGSEEVGAVTYRQNLKSKANFVKTFPKNFQSKASVSKSTLADLKAKTSIWKSVRTDLSSKGLIFQEFQKDLSSKGFVFQKVQLNLNSKANLQKTTQTDLSSKGLIFQRIQHLLSSKGSLITIEQNDLESKANLQKTGYGNIKTKASIWKSIRTDLGSKGSIKTSNQKDSKSKANLFRISSTILVSPADEASETSPVILVWEIPSDSMDRNIDAHLQIDKTSDAFGDLESEKFSYQDSGFEYWDGDSWEEYPAEGVDSAYYGNQARISVSLTGGIKYWRVRGGA